jgi:hypothetical protein
MTYEKSQLQTIGGTATGSHAGNGAYFIENPWGGVPAEAMIANIFADGAGTAWLTQGDISIVPLGNVPDEFNGIPFIFAASGVIHPNMDWTPFEGKLCWTVIGASRIFVSLAWRRALPEANDLLSFPAAERATRQYAAASAKASTTHHDRWGNGQWANVKQGTQRTQGRDYRDQPGSQGTRPAADLSGQTDDTKAPPSRGATIARLLRTGSLR